MLVDNKIALVTGAGRGLGRKTALTLADEGAMVILLGRNKEALQSVQKEITANEGKADIVLCDLTNETQLIDTVKTILKNHGRVDILVNNVATAKEALFLDITQDNLEEIMCVNFFSPVFLCRAFLPVMIENGAGTIVNVASSAGLRGLPGSYAYAASKAALINFTKSVGQEVRKQGVRINCICPGPMEHRSGFGTSEQIRMHDTDVMKSKTVANSILYLASDMSKDVCCQVITVRGASRW